MKKKLIDSPFDGLKCVTKKNMTTRYARRCRFAFYVYMRHTARPVCLYWILFVYSIIRTCDTTASSRSEISQNEHRAYDVIMKQIHVEIPTLDLDTRHLSMQHDHFSYTLKKRKKTLSH